MGIYISGVKGLPEQVQANKEDIKEVKEQIEGIDFEAVRQLQGQVAENTQDINNLEASIGVQNQTINALGDRTTALERKTQLMSYNDDLSMTDFRNSIEVADDVYASSVRVQGDGSLVNTTQSGMHFKEGANDDVLTIANNDGATPHYLHFNGDGTLDIDGNPVGGAPALYNHFITLNISTYNISFVVQLTLTKSTALTSLEFYYLLYDNGFRTTSSYLGVSKEYLSIDFANSTYIKMTGLYAANNVIKARIDNNGTTTSGDATFTVDKIIPVSQ